MENLNVPPAATTSGPRVFRVAFEPREHLTGRSVPNNAQRRSNLVTYIPHQGQPAPPHRLICADDDPDWRLVESHAGANRTDGTDSTIPVANRVTSRGRRQQLLDRRNRWVQHLFELAAPPHGSTVAVEHPVPVTEAITF